LSGNEFDIPLESDIRKDVNDMCNLSQGIKEQAYVEGTENGIAIGKQEGITIGKQEGIAETIIKMYRKGYEPAQISDLLDMEVEQVREIIENE
jgi:predicted transposase YdaD